jgi:hypothetical protein
MSAGSSPIRVGVALDGPDVSAWIAWLLDELRARDDVTLALAVMHDAEPTTPCPALFRLYEALDRRAFRSQPDAAAPVDASAALADVPVLRGDGAIADAVRRHRLDVLVELGSAVPPADVAAAPRLGAWSIRHDVVADVLSGRPVVETALEMRDGRTEIDIYRSIGSAEAVSLERNRNAACWKSASFVLRRLDDVAAGRWPPSGTPARSVSPAAPSNAQTLRHGGRVAGNMCRRKLLAATRQHQWFLGFRRRRHDVLPFEDDAPWHRVFPPADSSYADPFVVDHGDETLVFLERLPHVRQKGELVVGRLEDDGRLTDVEPILPVDHHISYPYVFEHAGEHFMIPETNEVRRVDLFAAVDFPVGWERVATLIEDVRAVDPTVLAHDGRLWLWVNIAIPGAPLTDETFLYVSDRLDGGWAPHPCSPVVSDARRARSGGRPFVHAGRLIRPSQDCVGCYGARVVFNEVELLTTDAYRERPVGTLEPSWAGRANRAAHTYTFGTRWEATDGLRAYPRVLKPLMRHNRPRAWTRR